MKKIFSYILTALIAANLFAPLSMSVDQNRNVKVSSNIAEAGGAIAKIYVVKRTENSLTFRVMIERQETENHSITGLLATVPGTKAITLEGMGQLVPKEDPAQIVQWGNIPWEKSADQSGLLDEWVRTESKVSLTGLTADTPYYFSVVTVNGTSSGGVVSNIDMPVRTTVTGIVDDKEKEIGGGSSTDGFMPSCGIADTLLTNGTIMGCVAQIIYYAVFQPTSFLFGLAGQFFDNTFAYSVDSAAYKNEFVVQGWGIVRDFVNMFFIFVLLYVAFSTILSVHGFKTKEMIINVVLIGLFINFSLFATQIIIDTSNILARVFYNSDAVKLKDKNGDAKESKPGDPIPLSGAIVSKVEPQRLILEGTKNVGIIDTVNGNQGATAADKSSNLGVGTFVLITLMAIGVNIVGMIVFATVGLLFVARVIGLWIAMVIVPLAFFSYTVPQMKSIDMIGWEKWWPETLKLAFLAPIFMFFMYIILKFLNVMTIVKTSGLGGVGFVLTIIVPFAFIMIMLNKAKSIAVKFSGDIGVAVTSAAKIAGGLAIGGAGLAAASGAALGRGLITNPLKMMQSSSATRNAALKNFSVIKPNTWGKAISARMANATIKKDRDAAGNVIKDQYGMAQRSGSNKLRDKLLDYKKSKSEKAHAEHVLDEQADKIKKGAKYSDLDANEQVKAKEAAQKENISQTLFGKASSALDNSQIAMLNKSLSAKKPDGTFDQSVMDGYARALNRDTSKFHDVDHIERTYNRPDNNYMGSALNSVANGTYDIRNMKGAGLTAFGIAAALTGVAPIFGAILAAHTSGAMRSGLKSAFKTDYGTGQKDFFKDMKNTLSEALKNIQVHAKVKFPESGGGGHDDHGTKKDDHGGGGHH